MPRNILLPAVAAVLVAVAAPNWAGAWGAAHVGYTHVGPNGVYHAGRTAAVGPGGAYAGGHAGAYGYGGSAYHAGYHYGGNAGYSSAGYHYDYHYSPSYYGGGGYHYGYVR
jgi:hypothetical protein